MSPNRLLNNPRGNNRNSSYIKKSPGQSTNEQKNKDNPAMAAAR